MRAIAHRAGAYNAGYGGLRLPTILAVILMFLKLAASAQAAAALPSRAAVDAGLAAAMPCEALQKQDFTGIQDAPTSIVTSRTVAASGSTGDYCDVSGYVQPQVGFELRLPTHGWNGRYFQVGCGGLCGMINIDECGKVLAQNYAVGAENMGHYGYFWKEPLWGSDPLLRIDFGPRSTHVTALAAKAIIARYYGATTAFAYFRGCSTGGREGLMEAQHYPADFNGIIAGDPAFSGRLGPLGNNWDARQLLRRDGSPVFPPGKLTLLHQAVLQVCDALDGLKDGIIDDPRACRFDVASLACAPGQDRPACLTSEQVRSATRLYDGARNRRGERLFPGHQVFGSEAGWDGSRPQTISDADLKYLTFARNPPSGYTHWDFDFEHDIPKVERAAALYDPVAPYQSPDLHRFRRLGGRLIVYHGWADPGVSPLHTLDYYARVTSSSGGLDEIRRWFRVFMIPGMRHCRGGDAPNSFDFMPAITAWVEDGRAPDRVIAAQLDGSRVLRTRPLVPYPLVARYTGVGDPNDATSWSSHNPPAVYNDKLAWVWAPRAGSPTGGD